MHPRVRQFFAIKHNRPGAGPGVVALEGSWTIRRALDAPVPVEVLFVCPALLRGDEARQIVEDARRAGALLLPLGERSMRRMTDREGPDGLAAIARLTTVGLDDIAAGPVTRVLVADRFELAGNVGTVIRCADGAGAAAVVLTDRQIRVTHPLVAKASMGTVFTMPVVDATSAETHSWLLRHGFRVIAADPAAPLSYRDADYRGRVAVVIGSERSGLAPFWRDAADATVAIPMLGRADSLNVGHAAALLLYEALHRMCGGDQSTAG